MGKAQDRYQAAMNVLKDDEAPLAHKMIAHEEILRFGMPGCGEVARQERMAEALGDICLAVAVLMTKAGTADN